MITNQEIAQKLRETAARLIKQAEELEAGIDRNKCQDGEYTDEPFTGCRTCGGKRVICSNPKVVGKRRNGRNCRPYDEKTGTGCKYFKPLKLGACDHDTIQ